MELSEKQKELKESAILISNLSELSNMLYQEISQFDILMIGEMHCTNEPAEFAYGLCELIAKNEDNVIMAMEIPPSQMESFTDHLSVEELKNMKFFVGENSSGMNGQAWLHLMANCNKNPKIKVVSFDHQKFAPRDSSMYVAIKEIRRDNPKSKIVTLSGNLHNRLKAYNKTKMLGCYLIEDSENFSSNKIASIMHFYNHGSMLNNTGNGLELREIESKENIFNMTVSKDKFFCKNIFKDQKYYTHILYTDKITHSKKIE